MAKAARLRALAIQAYWAASTPTEAKMAGILLDLFAPDVACRADDVEYRRGRCMILFPPARHKAAA